MDEIKPTPRGTLAGMLADALQSGHDFVSKPFGYDNPPARMLSEALGVPALARTADRLSYGEPLTTGRGMTTKPREDTVNALAAVAPAIQGGRAVTPVIRNGLAKAAENALVPSNMAMQGQRGAIVYHGSPHTFDKFDMSKIGTGEGAQAYGHGLYFADHPDTATNYIPRDPKMETRIMAAYKQAEARQQYPAMEVHEAYLLHKTPQEVEKLIAGMEGLTPAEKAAVQQAHKFGAQQYQKQQGALYKVDLPDEHIAKMLDWDKPLSQQPAGVHEAWVRAMQSHMGRTPQINPDTVTGSQAISMLTGGASGMHGYEQVAAQGSKALKQAGIPGIKYLDQGSRATSGGEIVGVSQGPQGWHAKVKVTNRGGVGFSSPTDMITTSKPYKTEAEARAWADQQIGGGTRNYVVFDDKLPKILERNGKSLTDMLKDALK